MSDQGNHTVIERLISNLLYTNDCVIIPDFGAFVKEHSQATFDYVQGVIAPPSSKIEFKEHIITDDGVLLDVLQSKEGMSLTLAKLAIQEYVNSCKKALESKEVINITNVGRIFKDYENQIKFIPENYNYNLDSFGLQEVKYYPVLRQMPRSEAISDKETIKEEIVKASSSVKTIPQWAKIAAPLVLILFVVSLFYFSDRNNALADADSLKISDTAKVNKSPENIEENEGNANIDQSHHTDVIEELSIDEDANNSLEEDINTPVNEEDTSNSIEETFNDKSVETNSDVNTNSSQDEFGKVIIGSFGSQKNVDKWIALILDEGWTLYTRELRNGATQLGVKVYSQEEADSMMTEIKNKIPVQPVFKRN